MLASTRTTRAHRGGVALLLVALSGATACYRYSPIPLAAVRPNEDVQLTLSPDAATRLVKELGTYTSRLEGPLSRQKGDSVSVSVLIGRQYQGVELESARMDLFLARPEVVGVRRREFSRTRTALATVGAIALFSVVVSTVVQSGDPNLPEGELPPPPPAGARFTVRIPLR